MPVDGGSHKIEMCSDAQQRNPGSDVSDALRNWSAQDHSGTYGAQMQKHPEVQLAKPQRDAGREGLIGRDRVAEPRRDSPGICAAGAEKTPGIIRTTTVGQKDEARST